MLITVDTFLAATGMFWVQKGLTDGSTGIRIWRLWMIWIWNHSKCYQVFGCHTEATVCICISITRREWGLWQQVMVVTLNFCILKNRTANIKEKRKDRRYVWICLNNGVIVKLKLAQIMYLKSKEKHPEKTKITIWLPRQSGIPSKLRSNTVPQLSRVVTMHLF